ncbi:type 1 glutamine amidotransferase domain-containing protein [Deinococcus roseus]|uniref:Dihydroxyacetone kinase n=1 Tax=Deinococcus roseus TaxID=392414 RepID=A0ABQ2D8F9_9DEIO|nr:type 1 glutamine amidotransferase domain-containing protein [Deinococcus roseus]GGJ49590.1 dihydroxyacetone kinase [Deinococcus roseus]
MTRRILFVLTSHDDLGGVRKTGFYVPEAAHPFHVFKQHGYQIDFVSPKGGKPPFDGLKLDDPQQKSFLEHSEVAGKLENTLTTDQVQPGIYDAIFYVGGHGTMWDFADNAALARIAAEIYEKGGVVSAVCHGPAGLVNIRLSNGEFLVKGKNVAAFTNQEEAAVNLTNVVPFLLESKLVERGAKHIPAANFQSNVQVSERLVTGQNPASSAGVAEAVVKLLQAQPVGA